MVSCVSNYLQSLITDRAADEPQSAARQGRQRRGGNEEMTGGGGEEESACIVAHNDTTFYVWPLSFKHRREHNGLIPFL